MYIEHCKGSAGTLHTQISPDSKGMNYDFQCMEKGNEGLDQ